MARFSVVVEMLKRRFEQGEVELHPQFIIKKSHMEGTVRVIEELELLNVGVFFKEQK